MTIKKYKNELIRQAHDWMVVSIYEASKLEGVPFTFPETEEIVKNEHKIDLKYPNQDNAVTIVINLKHAYQSVLDLANNVNYQYTYKDLLFVNRIIGQGLIHHNGNFRDTPVKIKHSTYKPPYPTTPQVWSDKIDNILNSNFTKQDVLNLYAYSMKQQLFNDGNKRTSLLFANLLLLSKEFGFISIPDTKIAQFGKNLINYYEGKLSQKQFTTFIDKTFIVRSFDLVYHTNGIDTSSAESLQEHIKNNKKYLRQKTFIKKNRK